MNESPPPPPRAGAGEILLRIAAGFLILEPVWMLLPFAGFLYGSVMHIRALSSSRLTAPLVHFVFPIHTLFPLGLLLMLAGLLLFLIGAWQIYSGKLRGAGLVRTGLYSQVRHPQYLALALFGLGIILTWGRLISYISYFVMLWLYFFLARREEERCRRTFGDEYDIYRRTTWFLFPGERFPATLAERLLPAALPGWGRAILSFLLVVVLALGSGLAIGAMRSATRQSIPALQANLTLPGRSAATLPLLMVEGPAFQGAPTERIRHEFMEKTLEALLSSSRIATALEKLHLGGKTTLLAFLTPGSNWFSSHLDVHRTRLNVSIFCVETPLRYDGRNFRHFRDSWRISFPLKAEELSYGNLENGDDPVAGPITTESADPGMEERIDFFLSGLTSPCPGPRSAP